MKHVNILKCLPLAKKCKAKHSKLEKTRESSLLAEYTGLFSLSIDLCIKSSPLNEYNIFYRVQTLLMSRV